MGGTELVCPLLVLLAYRIWDLDSKAARLRGHSRSPLRQILYIVVNAGVLYNITIIAVWICFALESNGQFVILDMVSPSPLACIHVGEQSQLSFFP